MKTTNITLKINSTLLREAKILAVEEGTSLSSLLAAKLEQLVREKKGYEEACQRAIAQMREGMDLGFTPPKSRDELYER
ncbi:MAG TPA: hypothetical protein VMH04_11605 [Candidatus Solibacter sp.]|nr:hypothetical protein [Candidatus Solibacter sp.]